MLDDINHTALIQEWKINLDAAEYEKKILMCINLQLQKISRHNSMTEKCRILFKCENERKISLNNRLKTF